MFGSSVFISNKDPLLHLKSVESVVSSQRENRALSDSLGSPQKLIPQAGVRARFPEPVC